MLRVYAWVVMWYVPLYVLLYVTLPQQTVEHLHFGWVSLAFLFANLLDSHSTAVALRAIGSLKAEQNPIARRLIGRFGVWRGTLLLKIPIWLLCTLACYWLWLAKLATLAMSASLVATAISNYRVASRAKAKKARSS